MPTHVQLAVRLLRDAAGFYRAVGEQNPQLNDQMRENASIYEQAASLLEQNPNGEIPDEGDDEPPAAA